LNKPQLQKALINAVLPLVGTDTQSAVALVRKEDRQFELDKLRLQALVEERKEERNLCRGTKEER